MDSEKDGLKDPRGRLNAHNRAYAGQFDISAENVNESALNPDWFVTRIEHPWQREIAPGVRMNAYPLPLGNEDFTNVYDICVSPDSPATLELLSFTAPRKPNHIFRDKAEMIAIANASFFYIIDDTDEIARQGPKDGTLNWCMRDGHIVGLPSADRPALVEIDGKLEGREIKARGELLINEQPITWVGGQHIMHAPKEEWGSLYDPAQAVVFNSACTAITKEDENPHAYRLLDKGTYHTPEHPDVVALAVTLDGENVLRVSEVREGGGMGLFDGHFILQVPQQLYRSLGIAKGDIVTPTTVDGIDLSRVHSALTVGPSVLDYRHPAAEHHIDRDKSFGQPPPFRRDKRYARTVVLKDREGIHMRIYDAVPMSTHFRGVSPTEIAKHCGDDVEWAFFCDGGQSSIIGTRDVSTDMVEFFGNKHYGTQKREAIDAQLKGEPSPSGSRLLGRPRPIPSAIAVSYRRETKD